MKLDITDDITENTEAMFRHIFDVSVRELGIADAMAKVVLRFQTGELAKALLGGALGAPPGPLVGGAVRVDGARDVIPMTLSIMPITNMIAAMCHEMVHVRQIVRGEIAVADGKHYYHGVEQAEYLNDPAEIEADSIAESLVERVMAEMPADLMNGITHDRITWVFQMLGLKVGTARVVVEAQPSLLGKISALLN